MNLPNHSYLRFSNNFIPTSRLNFFEKPETTNSTLRTSEAINKKLDEDNLTEDTSELVEKGGQFANEAIGEAEGELSEETWATIDKVEADVENALDGSKELTKNIDTLAEKVIADLISNKQLPKRFKLADKNALKKLENARNKGKLTQAQYEFLLDLILLSNEVGTLRRKIRGFEKDFDASDVSSAETANNLKREMEGQIKELATAEVRFLEFTAQWPKLAPKSKYREGLDAEVSFNALNQVETNIGKQDTRLTETEKDLKTVLDKIEEDLRKEGLIIGRKKGAESAKEQIARLLKELRNIKGSEGARSYLEALANFNNDTISVISRNIDGANRLINHEEDLAKAIRGGKDYLRVIEVGINSAQKDLADLKYGWNKIEPSSVPIADAESYDVRYWKGDTKSEKISSQRNALVQDTADLERDLKDFAEEIGSYSSAKLDADTTDEMRASYVDIFVKPFRQNLGDFKNESRNPFVLDNGRRIKTPEGQIRRLQTLRKELSSLQDGLNASQNQWIREVAQKEGPLTDQEMFERGLLTDQEMIDKGFITKEELDKRYAGQS